LAAFAFAETVGGLADRLFGLEARADGTGHGCGGGCYQSNDKVLCESRFRPGVLAKHLGRKDQECGEQVENKERQVAKYQPDGQGDYG